MTTKQIKERFMDEKFAHYGFYLRKSLGGWSIDKMYYGYPMFWHKCETREQAINWIELQITKIQREDPYLKEHFYNN